MRVGALIVRILRIECLWLEYQKTEILRIRIFRESYTQNTPRAGACVRTREGRGGRSAGKARGEARVARGSSGGALKTHMKSTRDARGNHY